MPDLLRRAVALTLLSALGIGLLAPLTARSAIADLPTEVVPLLTSMPVAPADAPGLDRGIAADRSGSAATTLAASATISAPELLASATVPTPPAAPMEATLVSIATPAPAPIAAPVVVTPPAGETLVGRASWYCHKVGTCPAGFTPSDAFVALPGALGGAGGRGVVGYVTVCADRCVELPVVDYCACYWGTADQRVADLSAAAWPLVTDSPRSAGVITVTLHLGA